MRKSIAAGALVAACWLPASMAQAGPYGDDLGKCVVAHTTDADRIAFMSWMFQAISAHPAVRSMVNINQDQRDAASKQAAQLMERLMTVDCRPEMVLALKYEGIGAIQGGFELFGKVAMQSLTADPEVDKAMSGLDRFLDESKFEALAKEAGMAPPKENKPK